MTVEHRDRCGCEVETPERERGCKWRGSGIERPKVEDQGRRGRDDDSGWMVMKEG